MEPNVTLEKFDFETSRDSQTIRDLEAQQDQSLAKAYHLRKEIRHVVWLEEQYGSEEILKVADHRERLRIILIAGLTALYLMGQLADIFL